MALKTKPSPRLWGYAALYFGPSLLAFQRFNAASLRGATPAAYRWAAPLVELLFRCSCWPRCSRRSGSSGAAMCYRSRRAAGSMLCAGANKPLIRLIDMSNGFASIPLLFPAAVW